MTEERGPVERAQGAGFNEAGPGKRSFDEAKLVKHLKDAFHENLLSVILYGSYTGENFMRGVSDINVLIILEQSRPEQMIELGRRSFNFMRKNAVSPLILTRSEFISSADIFPMEYLDIRERKRVLFGSDETEHLELSRRNLRHELEDRLRGSIASLRKLLLGARGRKRLLGAYLKALTGSLNAQFRGLLRLKGVSPVPFEAEKVLSRVHEEFNLDIQPFERLLQLRKGSKADIDGLVRDILFKLEELIAFIDRMQVKE